MTDSPHSIDRELIRYRVKKRMAGRRDLLIHVVIYVATVILFRMNTRSLDLENKYDLEILMALGALWTMPLILHGLRYFYRCGTGVIARADEIEGILADQEGRTALDDEEEMLIEERVAKRIAARRIVVAHLLMSSILVAMLLALVWLYPGDLHSNAFRINAATFLAFAFALHFVRFFLVHGRTSEGRALKIEAEVERQWFQSQEGRLARAPAEASGETDLPLLELGKLGGRQLRLNAEGEIENGDELAAGLTRR